MSTIIITEKTLQAQDLHAAIGNRYGRILPAQGHLLDLEEPEDVNSAWDWKSWDFELLRPPSGLYRTMPLRNGSDTERSKLKAIGEALKTASRVILATDCDVEGQVIGQELLEYFGFKGEVLRAIFNATDEKAFRQAFADLRPNREFQNMYDAGEARRQADQIFNFTLTRAASKSIKPADIEGALGIGRVKTATLGMICRRELEIRDFKAVDYFQIVASCRGQGGTFDLRHDPERYGDKVKLTDGQAAQTIVDETRGYQGPVSVTKEAKRRGPPKLFSLAEIQAKCGSRFGWTADKTLGIAQALYETHKILTYPRAEAQYLPDNHADDVDAILQALGTIEPYRNLVPGQTKIRTGKSGHFSTAALEGASHHAIVPNVNVMDRAAEIYGQLNDDERTVFDMVAKQYLAAVSPDWEFDQTVVTADIEGREFRAVGNVTTAAGWKAVFAGEPETDDDKEGDKEDSADLPQIAHGEAVSVLGASLDGKTTKPPSRFNQGSIIKAMKQAWKFVDDPELKEQLRDSEGIGTSATRAGIVEGLFLQNQVRMQGKTIVPTDGGLQVYRLLKEYAPALVDAGTSARWGLMLKEVEKGSRSLVDVVDEISKAAVELMETLRSQRPDGFDDGGKPTPKMVTAAKKCAERQAVDLPDGCLTSFVVCKAFLDEHLGQGRAPFEKMITAAERCAEREGVDLPDDYKTDFDTCKAFLDQHMAKSYPPSDKQIALVEKLAATNEKQPSAGWKEDAKKASAYIDACFKRSRKSKRKTPRR